jgi:primosomal protein N' (replication factor Y)
MHFYKVAVASLVHTNAVFTYHHTEILPRGSFVRVSIGRKQANGIVLEECPKPAFPTKEITSVLHVGEVLPEPLITLAEWLSEYYVAHLSLVLQSILPPGIQKQRRSTSASRGTAIRTKKDVILTPEQKRALQRIKKPDEGTFLLHGVPGSGKTQVYIEACLQAVAQNTSAIVLVPEIALTTQLIDEFAQYFKHTFVMHSNMTESERHTTWQKIISCPEPVIVIGPRSALFSPIKKIGLIIIDECHEQSFKQDRAPKYHAIYAARMLAKLHRAKLVLGSATPNITELYLAEQGRMMLLEMPKSIQEQLSGTKIVSHKERTEFTRHRFISNKLIESIEYSLGRGEQALLFHNRRGTSPSVICESCGWQAVCPHCDLPLTFHADHMQLRCHACNFEMPVPRTCPECQAPTLLFKGIGTKLIVSELTKLFPKAKIARFDADTVKTEQVQARYQELYEGKIDILVGTQVIAKGLDLPNVTTVGILQADAGLHLPDYTARERTFQLLYQAAGRAGRTDKHGQVIIQTYLPDNPIIMWAAQRDFASFYTDELHHRKTGGYPPFCFMLKLSYAAANEQTAIRNTKQMALALRAKYPGIKLLGPTPAFHEQLRGKHYWQIVIKSARRPALQQIAANLPNNWQFDIDPVSLL